MPKSAKKRLLAAQERFRRNYWFYIGVGKTNKDGVTAWPMHIEKRIPNHRRVWK